MVCSESYFLAIKRRAISATGGRQSLSPKEASKGSFRLFSVAEESKARALIQDKTLDQLRLTSSLRPRQVVSELIEACDGLHLALLAFDYHRAKLVRPGTAVAQPVGASARNTVTAR
jgi:hypothetical protein